MFSKPQHNYNKINNRRNLRNSMNIWKLNNVVPKNPMEQRIIRKEIRKYFEIN